MTTAKSDRLLERKINWPRALGAQSSDAREDVWEQLESLRSPTPFVEQVETTNVCSLTCVMCPRGRGQMTRKRRHMSDGLFRSVCLQVEEDWQERYGTERDPARYQVLDPASRIEGLGLRLHHFGSPLLDPHFIERAVWVKEHCTFPIHASISAEQFRKDDARRLVATGIDRLVIALDGTNNEEYRVVRGAAANYERAVHGIEALLEAKNALAAPVHLDVQLVDLRDDPALRSRFLAKWKGVDGLSVIIKPVFGYPDIDDDVIEGSRWSGLCAWPFLSIVVTVDGRVVLCCADYDAEGIIGDVREESLQQIWDGERYRDLRRTFMLERAAADGLCGRCAFYGRETC